MTRQARAAAAITAAVLTVAVAGCASAVSQAPARPKPPPPPSLATTLVTADGTWAVAELGGSAARHNNFWQLFLRPAGSAAWQLVTPPGVASNGGLVMAGLGGPSLITGFRPSQDLKFTPLATTKNNGSTWSPGVLAADLADVPDALAAAPRTGRLAALLAGGRIDQAQPGAADWTPLTSLHTLAEAPASHRCSPGTLTAVSFAASGDPLVGTACTRPGAAGIFSYTASGWRMAGPAMPAYLSGSQVQVLRLTGTAAGESALLAARSGSSVRLLVARTSDGTHWTLSSPLSLRGQAVRASGFAAAGAAWVLLANGQGYTITGQNAGWRQLPRLPAGTTALAFGPAASVDALTTRASKLTDWRLARGSGTWQQAQVLLVPIQYNSSS